MTLLEALNAVRAQLEADVREVFAFTGDQKVIWLPNSLPSKDQAPYVAIGLASEVEEEAIGPRVTKQTWSFEICFVGRKEPAIDHFQIRLERCLELREKLHSTNHYANAATSSRVTSYLGSDDPDELVYTALVNFQLIIVAGRKESDG